MDLSIQLILHNSETHTVLLALYRHGAQTPSEVTEATDLNRSRALKCLRNLLRYDLADRENGRTPLGQQTHVYELTDEGAELAERLADASEVRHA